jgi:hypothetical protein
MRISEYYAEDYLTSIETLKECRENVIKDREFQNEFCRLTWT